MAALADSNTTLDVQLRVLQESARSRDIELSIHRWQPSTPRKHGATALNVSPVLWANRYLIMDRVAALHLPAMYHRPKYRRKVVLPPNGPRDAQLLRDWLRRAFSLGFQAGEIAVFIPWRGRQPN